MTGSHSSDPIPVIDLAAGPDPADVLAACEHAGCFNLAPGFMDQALTDELLDRMKAFFSLPDDDPVKRECHRDRNEGANGWTPMLEEPAYQPGTIAWVESFGCVLPRSRIAQLPDPLRERIRPSIWPRIDGFREAARAQWAALTTAAQQIYPLVSALLQQERGFLAERASSQALNTMRLLNYPPQPADSDARSTGISAHTDFECITLIYQTAPGLEVMTPKGRWVQVPVLRGQWTVLLGDMVERWSNGGVRATPHRVPATRWPRMSIVMFMAADHGVEVRPLDAFIGEDRPARFGPITQDELISRAMARAEANRKAMLPEVEKLRAAVTPD